MRDPSERQRFVHDTLIRLGGNTEAAAAYLGISGNSVRMTERRYLEATGELPSSKVPPIKAQMAAIPKRLDAIEALIGSVDVRVTVLLETAMALRDQVREMNARAPVLLVERYATHRRQRDGGAGGKAERGNGNGE